MSTIIIRPMRAGEPAACEDILRSLPEWFGIEETLVQYVRDLETYETYVADQSGRIVGFLTIHQHNRFSAEIHVMGVRPELHGRGTGRGLVEATEEILRTRSVEFLQVKTLSPSRPNEEYERTRGFYSHLGFRPLEENNLWGAVNPCLVMIKYLGGSESDARTSPAS